MVCPRCAKDNAETNLFCGFCGLDLAQAKAEATPIDEPVFCYRHKKEPTLLRCGKCDRPICYKCVMTGASGPRCPDCGRQKIPFSLNGTLASVRLTAGRIMRGNPWSIVIAIMVVGFVFNTIRSCNYERPRELPTSASDEAP